MATTSTKTAADGPSYPITSVDNALRLLLMFGDQRRLRLSDVSTSLGVAHSTAHRLLAMLVHHDFVRQEGDLRTYVAGPALLDLGLAAVRNMDTRTLARPILEDLMRKVQETVHVSQLEGGKIRYLASAECDRPLRVADRTGQMMPAFVTASGKALLAELTLAQLDELYPAEAVGSASDKLSQVERKALDTELAAVRERGYAINYRETEDIMSVATAVRDGRGHTVAALNASAPSSRMGKRRQLEIVRQLHAAAARLEDLLVNPSLSH